MKKYFVLFLLFLLPSCHRGMTSRLNIAEDLLSSFPDSALVLLQTIAPEELKTRKVEARFALLLSAALDKNYIDISSDSLIKKAVDYYSQFGQPRDKMLSWYYQGICFKNAGKDIPAILAFEKAEKEADSLEDWLYLGLILRNKANLFNSTNNNSSAIENRRKAIDYFEKADAERYKAYAQLSLAIDYSNDKQYDKADSLIELISTHYPDYISLKHLCAIKEGEILVIKESEPGRAIKLFQSAPRERFDVLDFGYLAQAYEMVGESDSTDLLLSEGFQHCSTIEQLATLEYMKAFVEERRGHYHDAFKLIDHATTVQDSVTRVILQQSISSAQRDYFKSESLLQEEKIQSMRQRAVLKAVLGVLLVSLFAMITISRSRKKDRLLQEQIAILALEERELERVNRDNAHLVGSLFSEKIDHLDRLSEAYFRMDEGKEKDLAFKQIKQIIATLRKDPELFNSLEKDLDRYCNGIMTKLSIQVPRISGDNRRIIALFFAGYSYEIAKLILNKLSIESLKMARSRFRKDIRESDAPDTEFFLKMLEMKKRPQAGTNENIGDC